MSTFDNEPMILVGLLKLSFVFHFEISLRTSHSEGDKQA